MKKQLLQEKIDALLQEVEEAPIRRKLHNDLFINGLKTSESLEDKLECVKQMYQVVIDAGMAYALRIWTDRAIEMMEELYEVDEIEY